MLQMIGCLVIAAAASAVAIPICTFCAALGSTGIAVLAGAGFVMSMIPNS